MALKRKIFWGTLAAAVVLGGVLALGGFKFLRAQRLIMLANKELERNQLLQAGFYAQLVWRTYPHHDDALRILATVSTKLGSPEQLLWLGKWCENNPSDPGRKLEFAQALLSSGQTDAAAKILESAEATSGVDLDRLGGLKTALALKKGDSNSAETELRRQTVRKPDDSAAKLNLANFLVSTEELPKMTEGRQLLIPLAEAPKTSVEAARSLLALALYEKNTAEMRHWVSKLMDQEKPTLADLFSSGRAFVEMDQKLPVHWFQKLSAACRNQAEIYASLVYLRELDQATAALAWVQTLPSQLQSAPLARVGKAEILTDLGEWDVILTELPKQNWEKEEYFRAAFLQEAYVQKYPRDRSSAVRATLWKTMVNSLASSPLDFPRLDKFLAHRSWPQNERELLASDLAARIESAKILIELLKQAQTTRGTPVLYALAKRLVKIASANDLAINNLAMYRMLLGRELEEAHQDAERIAARHPDVPGFQTTFAFALYQQNKMEEALEIISRLPPAELNASGPALCIALIYSRAGKHAETEAALQRVDTRIMLPEEQALFETCKSELAAQRP